MRNKFLVCGISLVLVGSLIGAGCAPAAEAELKPCEVSVPLIETLYIGAESISLAPVFTIYNPNDYDVNLKKLEYEVVAKDWLLGGRNMALEVFIPAKGEIKVSSAFTIGFIDLALWLLQTKPISINAAAAGSLPLWKGMDGKLPIAALQPIWDGLPVERPVFDIKGKIYILSAEGQDLVADFSDTWQMPEEVQMWK